MKEIKNEVAFKFSLVAVTWRMDITGHQINGVEGKQSSSEFRGKGQRVNKCER